MIGLFKKAIVDFPVGMQATNYRLSSIAAYMILLEQRDKSGVKWSIGIVKYLSYLLILRTVRGRSRGRVRGFAPHPPPPPPRDDLRFSNTTGILQKKNYVVY